MSGLADFITARLGEDEAMAKACAGYRWRAAPADILIDSDDSHWNGACVANAEGDSGQHIARHDPARVLREVTAKRAILAAYQADPAAVAGSYESGYSDGHHDGLELTVAHLASAWSDHPGYRAEWKPATMGGG